jgi:hypothetical protein
LEGDIDESSVEEEFGEDQEDDEDEEPLPLPPKVISPIPEVDTEPLNEES